MLILQIVSIIFSATRDEKPRAFGRGAQLLMNAGQSSTVNGVGGKPARGPQAKVFGIPEGTDHVCFH